MNSIPNTNDANLVSNKVFLNTAKTETEGCRETHSNPAPHRAYVNNKDESLPGNKEDRDFKHCDCNIQYDTVRTTNSVVEENSLSEPLSVDSIMKTNMQNLEERKTKMEEDLVEISKKVVIAEEILLTKKQYTDVLKRFRELDCDFRMTEKENSALQQGAYIYFCFRTEFLCFS